LSDGIEVDNNIDNCVVNIGNNSGVIKYNNVSQGSFIQITNISASGIFNFNNVNSQSTIIIADIQADFGNTGVKGVGNAFSDCRIEIGTFGITAQMSGNNFTKTDATIITFNGSIMRCNFQGASIITIDNMNNETMSDLGCKSFIYGTTGWSMPQSYVDGVFGSGLATIECILDCSDPAIYDIGLQTLTIPNELKAWGGIFKLLNANGLTIVRIINTIPKIPFTFNNDSGTTTFVTTPIGVATMWDLISSSPAPAILNITYRIDGSDYIVGLRSGFFMGIIDTEIFV
jgi:hypothetical protein